MKQKRLRQVFLSLMVFTVLSLTSCSSIQNCKVKVKPSVILCEDYCKDTEGIYSINRFLLDGVEGKVICNF